MICQSIKREQWVDKLKNKLLKVPYVHLTFTLPHQLNGLARLNQKLIYAMIMKASWLTIQEVMTAINATAGMTSVLHTFGSDMKYHIHAHCLVTFGGLNKQGKWQYPTDKYKLAKYRIICATFKSIFMQLLEQAYQNNEVIYHEDCSALTKELIKLRWVVNSTRPTIDTSLIENYLARYINRIAVSNNRLKYIIETKKVVILYNDYKQQKTGEAAPKAIKNLTPLVAIDQILQHVLPRHFQKSRSFGLHHACNKLKSKAENALKNNSNTIRTLFEIISHLMGLEKMKCSECQCEDFEIETIQPDKKFIQKFLTLHSNKSPPNQTQHIASNPPYCQENAPTSKVKAMYQFQK